MQANPKNLFDQFTKLARNVKQDFKNKGLVVPSRLPNGDIQVGTYVINRKNHLYYIRDKNQQLQAGPLNLAQTAVVVANDLALGRGVDATMVRNDAWYGYREFDEQIATHIADVARKEKDYNRAEISQHKAVIAQEQKLQYKRSIDTRYNKLCKLT
jgi:hypothetical protein